MPDAIPPQHQEHQPGRTGPMTPKPRAEGEGWRGSGKLEGKVAMVTGGDSGIGRAVSIFFAKEGADVAILYLDEHDDAADTRRHVEAEGRRCVTLAGDVSDPAFCRRAVDETIKALGRLDVLVNNAAEQHPQEDFLAISPEQLERTFRTNIFAMFHLTQAALPHLPEGGAIINSTSVTAYRGSPHLIDYAATKGAIVSFTRSLATNLAPRGVRVNAVAPGPIWTPLIPASFEAGHVETFGRKEPLGGPGHPDDVAPSYVFLASQGAAYMTGQVLHPNGGEAVGG
ncbi:MAG: SDR family oxidoreductase [Alphaproteobacteria bacterium]|nr:SDR family oxidoreductase [Alphaproteobacteria bacterium]